MNNTDLTRIFSGALSVTFHEDPRVLPSVPSCTPLTEETSFFLMMTEEF